MKYKQKTHIVFDLDDTLTDSYSFNQDLFVETFKPHISDLDRLDEDHLRQLHKDSRGTSMTAQFQEAINFLRLNVKPEMLVSENEILHTEKAFQIKMFPWTRQFLEKHRSEGRILSICTNRQTQSSSKILENNQIVDYFTKIVSCSDEGHEKPDPFCLNKLISEFNVSKENVLYVGDSSTDQLFAQNAGVEFELVKV